MTWNITEPEMTKLYQYCMSLSHSPWTAEDLVQETLIRVMKVKKVQPDRTLAFSFLCTIAKNLFIDDKRKQRDTLLFEDDLLGETDHLLEYDSLIELLLSALPLKQAMLVTLKDVFQFTSKEMASMLRTSDESIKTALHRARTKLKAVEVESVHSNIPDHQLIAALTNAMKEANPQQIFLLYRQLETRHFQVKRAAGTSFFHVIDPDGNILELYHR